jgi:hypothetical protein
LFIITGRSGKRVCQIGAGDTFAYGPLLLRLIHALQIDITTLVTALTDPHGYGMHDSIEFRHVASAPDKMNL